MREGQPTAIQRAAYTAPAFWIDTVDLTFDLDPAKTRVLNKMRLRRNPDVAAQPLRLDGEDRGFWSGRGRTSDRPCRSRKPGRHKPPVESRWVVLHASLTPFWLRSEQLRGLVSVRLR